MSDGCACWPKEGVRSEPNYPKGKDWQESGRRSELSSHTETHFWDPDIIPHCHYYKDWSASINAEVNSSISLVISMIWIHNYTLSTTVYSSINMESFFREFFSLLRQLGTKEQLQHQPVRFASCSENRPNNDNGQ